VADVHHHAVRVSVRAMGDLVLVEKPQTLVGTFSIGGGGVEGGTAAWGTRTRTSGRCSRPRSRQSAVAGSHSRSVEQARRVVPRVVSGPHLGRAELPRADNPRS